jgi:hypothetical protein
MTSSAVVWACLALALLTQPAAAVVRIGMECQLHRDVCRARSGVVSMPRSLQWCTPCSYSVHTVASVGDMLCRLVPPLRVVGIAVQGMEWAHGAARRV